LLSQFTFLDERGLRQVVLPRRNRLVVFSSGEENVHSVGVVTSGERTTLNLWLSRDKRVAAPNDD
jgi:predicted 2-oxoglutarate/Fe(II)-dependent dioxygenase YbiX